MKQEIQVPLHTCIVVWRKFYAEPCNAVKRSTMDSTFVYIFYAMFFKEVSCVDIWEPCGFFDITLVTRKIWSDFDLIF